MRLPRSLRLSLCGICGWLLLAGLSVGETPKKKLLLKPQYDPAAPKIGLFEALDQELISVQVVAKNSEEGALLVDNLSGQPLTVELPPAFVGVQVLPQFGGGLGGQQGGGFGGGQGGQQGGLGGGQNQSFGGGGQQGGGIGGGQQGGGIGGGGGGFFSVPPDRIARVPYSSVCLEHGKAEPRPQVKYRLVRPEEFSNDPVLREVLKLVATGKLDKQAAQAAAWHVANGMSWQELASKTINHVNAPDSPYFSLAALQTAQRIVAEAQRRAHEAEVVPERPSAPPVKPRLPETAQR